MKKLFFILLYSLAATCGIAQNITYGLCNGQITGTSPQYYEFDITIQASVAGIKMESGMVYLDYNEACFGISLHQNNKIQLQRNTFLGLYFISPLYFYDPIKKNDNAMNRVGIQWESPFISNLPDVPTTLTQLCHIKFEIANANISPVVSLYGALMQNQTYNENYATIPLTINTAMTNGCAFGSFPFVLANFDGHLEEKKDASLNWQTLSETNTASFEVERSLENQQFERIGEVAAAGNSTQMQSYQYLDKNVNQFQSTLLYYRLKMLDIDGQFTYSNTVELRLDEAGEILGLDMYPNPAEDYINIVLWGSWEEEQHLEIYDVTGKKVVEQVLPTHSNSQVISTKHLDNGCYFVRIRGLEAFSKVLLIQR